MKKSGFTLMEILVVIAMIGILATIIMGTYLTSLKRGRDNRRKQDLEQVGRALELYYAQNNTYPTMEEVIWGSPLYNPADNTRFYMKQLPVDPSDPDGDTYNYYYNSSELDSYQSYQLYSCLENERDSSYQEYVADCGIGCGNKCYYGIASPNSTP
ncbi:hypothetical protein A2313_03640 [Candidatus Roizmanbacteria bacterium RIFOXYB2_FULL_41_10]|uniref:Type II secretion system protein GspG C-terminal domain-containing protein n=1 Tax=Candidatus Roizmanbacteria bacterium RIFOXYA1_FULL_41_12 TaxID=1802082 RepID=A0A1F7KEM3_9BACT|nr:MAG: hypothetical protein A2209_02030 [Candidatus Roizmanbacteria bacterium RIFOXYA1_FULL_41_12]OGK67116.1 MAG: hypothetical protein A2377_00415 [Candidatus Roizmanbacteria bacterium RIFOXYB1_FULL_41_27]OGK69023.1 MAG: hypothetical protein A2313_03640 [Candidatus Roizmanbacteria bacterium RIFOXYB2_FULL_41_10]OGK71520.1 MAG: hypothetical protein A2403_00755 [Candidatus Roizmanbacteria bacterium RIFOXYC1_FULL_41_16]